METVEGLDMHLTQNPKSLVKFHTLGLEDTSCRSYDDQRIHACSKFGRSWTLEFVVDYVRPEVLPTRLYLPDPAYGESRNPLLLNSRILYQKGASVDSVK
jgi:hypothetical protein